jgi:hypothetical protein
MYSRGDNLFTPAGTPVEFVAWLPGPDQYRKDCVVKSRVTVPQYMLYNSELLMRQNNDA